MPLRFDALAGVALAALVALFPLVVARGASPFVALLALLAGAAARDTPPGWLCPMRLGCCCGRFDFAIALFVPLTCSIYFARSLARLEPRPLLCWLRLLALS